MRYCVKCGNQVEDTMKFCPSCGAEIPRETEQKQQNTYEYGGGQSQQNTYEYGGGQYTQQTNSYSGQNGAVKEEGESKVLAVLSYLGLLVFVPVLSGNKSEFVKFHANQGLVLFICSVLWNTLDWILSHFVWFMEIGIISLGDILNLGDLFLLVLMIIGIVNACRSEKKELPVIGGIVLYK